MSVRTQLVTIVGDGPVGADILELSKLGVKNVVGARYYVDYIPVRFQLLAASVDHFMAGIHDGIWQVHSIFEAHTVVGGSGAAVDVVVCPQGVAIASGVTQQSAAFDLTVTAPAKAFATLIASPTLMTRGDVLGVNMAGTLTGLVGILDVLLKRVG